jgi:hypothetical protein
VASVNPSVGPRPLPVLWRSFLSWGRPAVLRLPGLLRRTFASVLEHDCLNIAQACAYSAMVSLFPGLIVAAAVFATLPDSAPIRTQAALFFDRILPDDVSPILDSYFENSHQTAHSNRALALAAIVSLIGASGVIVTLMEGFRRAYNLSAQEWGFWDRRWRSFALVPIALVPLAIASVLVIFGHFLSEWIAANIGASAVGVVLVIAFVVRWTAALSSSRCRTRTRLHTIPASHRPPRSTVAMTRKHCRPEYRSLGVDGQHQLDEIEIRVKSLFRKEGCSRSSAPGLKIVARLNFSHGISRAKG